MTAAKAQRPRMQPQSTSDSNRRYRTVASTKAEGATYTPQSLARFVAHRIVECADLADRKSIEILDPAIGDGELVIALLDVLADKTRAAIAVRGFDTDITALEKASQRITAAHPAVCLNLTQEDFLDFVSQNADTAEASLFAPANPATFDLIIANPPYVRTQIMGSERAQRLSGSFGMDGRVDLYQAFLLGMVRVLAPNGTAGIIVSNRFMTTKGSGGLRAALRRHLSLRRIWDLGDTKLFDAAVLPAVIVARGSASASAEPARFSSIYAAKGAPVAHASDPIAALEMEGVVEIEDGRRFSVRHGTLDASASDDSIWRISSLSGDRWLATVDRHTWKRFGDIGKIRVGVKTCADKIFIRHDWDAALGQDKPELLRPLTTHHSSGRFRAIAPKQAREILYPHEHSTEGRRAISLSGFPKSRAYLESHRETLESRSYVVEAGRRWYELWVPQDPRAWALPKLVFRDISERPMFWVDLDGTVVNGDCYWMTTHRAEDIDLLWLAAAIANSTFVEAFYDHRFNNKLYAGRRRFITQYVELFPLPDPTIALSGEIVARAKSLYASNHAPETERMESELDALVWRAFGSDSEEIRR